MHGDRWGLFLFSLYGRKEVIMSVTPGVGAMDESEVMSFIKDSRAGILTLIDGDKPYPVAQLSWRAK